MATNPATLNENAQHLRESFGTNDVEAPGGLMPREVYDEFYREAVEDTPLLDAIRTENIGSPKTRIPKFGVGERQRRGQAEGSAGARGTIDAGYIDIDAKKGSVSWGLNKEVVENYESGEEIAEFILDRMTQQFAVDTQELAIVGDEESDTGDADFDDFRRQNNGFIRLAEEGGMPTYVHRDDSDVSQPINSSLFASMVQEMSEKYRSATDPIFITSSSQLHAYREHLTGEYDSAGFSVLMGSNDLTPFDYDVMGLPRWPDDKMMFTDPQNLIYCLFRDVEVDVLTESDETFEKDLFAKYFLRTRDDFAIENTDAGVLATDIASPTPTASN